MSDSTTFVRLFVGFLLSATGVGVHASCPIEVSPTRIVVRHGDPVSSNCSTSEKDFEGIGWEASKGGTGLQETNHLTWTVNELTDWDVSPLCFINPAGNSTFGQCDVKLDILLYTFPETIDITSTSGSNGVMREKEQHSFTCDIHNIAPVQNLTVRWYKGDTLYYTDTLNDPSKKPVNQSSVLRFTPSREDNGVTFRCEAHMDLGPEGPQFNLSSQKISFEVFFGPDVPCSDPELWEGETLEKHCPVTGNPPPIVTWLKDGQLIDPAVPLTREKTGLYTMKAEGLSLIEKKLQVLVLYGPELICPSTYTALEYAPHNLTCIVEGYPQPKITWYKDNEEEVELPENLTRRDTGQYLIVASNNLSSVNHIIEITVIYPPSQILELEDSEVDVGSTVWLKCSSTGNPRPKYVWDYYQAANVKEENEDGVSRLVIDNAMAYNMGSYTCHAWNDKGNVSKTVRVTVKGAEEECPIEITPDRMVIQYRGSGPIATCQPTSTSAKNLEGEIFWEGLPGQRTNSTSLSVDTKNWYLRPACVGTFKGIGPCHKHLNFTLYKTPDSVSIHSVDNSGLVVEGTEFQLQCNITNVAPAGNLTVQWYRGNETFQTHTKGSLQVPGCLNVSRCNISEILSPLSVVSTINVTLNRTDNGAEFRCEALLDLGIEPRPNMESSLLNITVHYKPTINTTKLPKTIPVFSGYPEDLVCEADGHPAPEIRWVYVPEKKPHLFGQTLRVSEAGSYTCNASNAVDTVSHEVEVILKEDYLPLIAGFVAVTVVIISVIFIFIYSIYYKNTKMRRYSLKNPKLSTHNGNVAHNGWDMQFPMTKLS